VARKISYLTIVGNTAYFFCKGLNYLLPIPITATCITNVINSSNFTLPQMHNTFIRTLKAFGTSITRVNIYRCDSDTYLAYIRIKRGTTTLDINSTFEDCLVFAANHNVQVTVEEELLLEKGFFVSKEMVEKALIENEVT
jgi:bifunctional DNase/RNase